MLISCKPTSEVAHIVQNQHGNWTVILPGAGRNVGNYATRADAERFAHLNGYVTEEKESATCQR